MFTGIIEDTVLVKNIQKDNTNYHFTFQSKLASELKVDQSVAHNGVCLTVVDIDSDTYTLTAINETMLKTNLGDLKVGDIANVERCMIANGRLDGHIVQGHVDQTGECISIKEEGGSWHFRFKYNSSKENITVSKGSICINGVSLTVVDPSKDEFSVAIIPYTYEHTNFKNLKIGSRVNLEFDIIGKYVSRLLDLKNS